MGEKPVPKMEYITLKQTFEFLMLILAQWNNNNCNIDYGHSIRLK